MSPEVMQSQRYTEKADVFSFGIILWEVLFRQVPYQGYNSVQVSIAVITQNLRPPIPSDTPPELARLMQDCWATVRVQGRNTICRYCRCCVAMESCWRELLAWVVGGGCVCVLLYS